MFVGPILSTLVMLSLRIRKLSVTGFSGILWETLWHSGQDADRNIATVAINTVALLVTSSSLLFIFRY